MSTPSGRPPRGGLGRLVAGTVAFALFAPAGLITLPFAALVLISSPRTGRELIAGGAALGYSLLWLVSPGTLPDQMVRAGALIGTAVFGFATLRPGGRFIHNAVLASGAAACAAYVLALMLGMSWDELRWWVEHETGAAVRAIIGQLSMGAQDPGANLAPGKIEAWLGRVVAFLANFHPAITVLQLLAGMALGTAICARVASRPRGPQLGRLRDFAFTEHLGWAAAIPLVVILVPWLAAAKTTAANFLLVAGALYALRGLAVGLFLLHLVSAGGAAVWIVGALVLFFLLPVLVLGAIVLGVVDSGLDLRRRMQPRSSE